MKAAVDIMDGQPKIKPLTTMLEINDNHRTGEYSGESYFHPFVELIQSLGYKTEAEAFFKKLTINDITFEVDVDSASYMAQNQYTRNKYQRKPENRFVTLKWRSYESNYILKVFINKETPVAKIKMKIDKAIEWHKNKEQQFADKKMQDNKNTETIALHYLKNSGIRKSIKYVLIEKGTIFFAFHDSFSLKLNADGTFVSAQFYPIEMKSIDDIDALANSVLTRTEDFESVCKLIIGAGQISNDLIEWSKDRYHIHFYTETMSTEK